MKKIVLLLTILLLTISCKKQEKTDLSQLNLNESIEKIINFNDTLLVGIETMEYPFCLLVEVDESEKYSFEGIDLKGQKIIFQINSEKLKTDSITRFGGAHINMKTIKNDRELKQSLEAFNAENNIYGVRIEMNNPNLKSVILKKIESKYGKGIKNPNTDNGLFWNIKKENKYILFAPDYDRLIILNNTNLSKTCYWDTYNGLIDFGGCDNEKYTQELVVNSTKPGEVTNKPIIKIDKNWNINGLAVGISNEEDLVKSKSEKNSERVAEIDGSTGNITEIYYINQYNDLYFYISANKKDSQNKKDNIIIGYTINEFEKVQISFENELKAGMKFDNVLKLIDKKLLIDYKDLEFAKYIEIKNGLYKVTLSFDENKLFSGLSIK